MTNFKLVILTAVAGLFFSCGNKTTITKNSIYYTGWKNGEYQAFTIAKIQLAKPNISVFDKNFNRFELSEYSIDSSFCFHPAASTKDIKTVGEIYFDQVNEPFAEWFSCSDFYRKTATIGALKNNNWYIILGLGGDVDYYVYIDYEGKPHTFSLGPTNW